MTEKKWKIGEIYKTRDGRNVIIYAIYPKQKYGILGAVFDDGRWCPDTWTLNGAYYEENGDLDSELMPPEPETHVRWVNVYSVGSGGIFRGAAGSFHVTRETADKQSSPDRKACIRIKWHEGQYDD